MTQLKLNDLKKGDVLLFEGMKDDFISAAIMFLTDSKVSHAAMIYNEKNELQEATLVHEASPKVPVSVRDAAKSFGDHTITVRRFIQPIASEKLIDAADHYLLEKAPYNNNGLYLVGIILIYRKISPFIVKKKRLSYLLEKLLNLAAKLVTHYLNSKNFPKQHPMTCSQFVAQCYDDAGVALFKQSLLTSNDSQDSLLDQIESQIRQDPTPLLTKMQFESHFDEREEDLVKQANDISQQFIEALQQEPNDMLLGGDCDSETHHALLASASKFALAHYQLQAGLLGESNSIFAPIEWLKEQRNLFVSPADLLNCDNLMTAGEIKLK